MPAILVRTPYGKGADITPHHQAFVEHGYAIVVQDVRGRYESEGAFQPLTQEVHDGDDTLELDRAPAVERRQDRHDGRVVRGHRPVEGRAGKQSAPESDLPGGLRLRRLSRPLLFHRRRLETRQPPGVDGGESARARATTRISASSCCICRCARPTWRRSAGLRRCTGRSSSIPRSTVSGAPSARENSSTKYACRCSRWAAGTTISCRATWRPTPRCASEAA